MQVPVNPKRRYYTKSKKIQILNELESGGITHTELARRHMIHPVTLYQWKRQMGQDKPENQPDYQELLDELEKIKAENENLKKALGEVAVNNQILQTANDIYKKKQRQRQLKLQKKSSKKQENQFQKLKSVGPWELQGPLFIGKPKGNL